MAENKTPTAPTFQFNQVYLKDASFESPCSPEVFGPKNPNRNPAIDVQLKIQHQRVADTDDIYEVVLAITCTAKSDEDTLFTARPLGNRDDTHLPEDLSAEVCGARTFSGNWEA